MMRRERLRGVAGALINLGVSFLADAAELPVA
jgi:hypothetical protein